MLSRSYASQSYITPSKKGGYVRIYAYGCTDGMYMYEDSRGMHTAKKFFMLAAMSRASSANDSYDSAHRHQQRKWLTRGGMWQERSSRACPLMNRSPASAFPLRTPCLTRSTRTRTPESRAERLFTRVSMNCEAEELEVVNTN